MVVHINFLLCYRLSELSALVIFNTVRKKYSGKIAQNHLFGLES